MLKTNRISFIFLILSSTIVFSLLVPSIIPSSKSIFAQSVTNTIKSRNLVIDLGNGIKTNAQLTLPTSGKSSYPGVLLVNFGGPQDMNDTSNGIFVKGEFKTVKPFWQIAQYLSEKGFAVLRYDKRGIGANDTVINGNVWGNATFNDLKNDAEKALAVLIQQPEIDDHKISILGHSEGSFIAPRIAIDNPGKIKNIILMATSAQNETEGTYNNILGMLQYAKYVVDKNKDGLISLKEAFKSPLQQMLIINDTGNLNTSHFNLYFKPFNSKSNNKNESYISIDNGIKPFLMNIIKPPTTTEIAELCYNPSECPIMKNSSLALPSLLSIIDKIPSNTSILLLEGENDSPEQVLMLNQRLNEIHHPNHSFIVYPGLGHSFYPSPKWTNYRWTYTRICFA